MAQEQSDGQNDRMSEIENEWRDRRLAEVIDHIVQTHHPYCRAEGSRLQLLFKQALAADKGIHPELKTMYDTFTVLNNDLANHMVKEEQTLFPHISRLETSVFSGEAVTWPPYGTVANPIRIMIVEHGKTNIELGEMNRLSHNFEVPQDAPGAYAVVYTALYEGLQAYLRDMEQHVALEERVLFPRAVAMEAEACSKPAGK